MEIIYLVFGILFALLIMSYFISERSKKKTKTEIPVEKEVHVEPKIGNVESIVPTTTHKLHRSTAKLNELLKDKTKQAQFKDDMKVLRGKMTEEEYNTKWANREAS